MKRFFIILFIILFCANPIAQSATINFNTLQQRIDGFGAADAFLNDDALTDAQADLFFNTESGIGLSLLRVGIYEDGTIMSFYSNAQKAAQRGARIFSETFTAPGTWKDNGSIENGGHLLTNRYSDWADRLAAFQGLLQSNAGVNLYALTIQNEPDFSAPYRSMLYTTTEMTNFLKVLGPKIAALSPIPLIVTPDTAGWDGAPAYISAIEADGTAASYLGIISTHSYGGTIASLSATRTVWMTEMSYFDAFDPTMTNALVMAANMHSSLTTGNVNAWCWWWILRDGATDNEGLTDVTQVTKRLYVMGNWSKFVRPGYYRVNSTGGPSGVSITAFKSTDNGKIVIVAINTSGSTQTFDVNLTGVIPSSVVPNVTSSTQNLVALTPVSVSSNKFSAVIANNTVTSFTATLNVPVRIRIRGDE